MLSLLVPVAMSRIKILASLKKVYGVVGIIALALVLVIAPISGGAKLGFEIGGFGIQPSEFVKILFVFLVAASFAESVQYKNIVTTTAIAAAHVLILVVSKDLGAALIIFVVYLVMLYVATRQPLYIVAGLGAGSAASVLAYHLFTHIRTRVHAWKDPFADYSGGVNRFYFFSNCRGNGADLCTLPDFSVFELLCYVSEYCAAACKCVL